MNDDPRAALGVSAQRTILPDRVRWSITGDASRVALTIRALTEAGLGGWRVVESDSGIVLERANAPTLAQWLEHEGGHVAWPIACARAIEIARALAWCEQHDRFPGPLGPDVVLVLEGSAVVVADSIIDPLLGGATAGAARSDGARVTRWIAPEQAGGATWDHAANRYVLGLVLYRMLAGAHPFGGRGLRRALDDQSNRGAPPLPDTVANALPAGLQGFVLRLLDPDPQARPRRASAIVDRLGELLGGTAPATSRVTRPTEPPAVVPPAAQPVHVPIATLPTPSVALPSRVPPPQERSAFARGVSRWAWVLAAIPVVGGVALGRHLSLGITAPPPPAGARVGERAPLSSAQTDADDCATCHPDHTAQWHGSVMAHAVKSPLFQGLEILIQEQAGRGNGCEDGAGILRASDGRTACRDPQSGVEITGAGGAGWCVNCHAPAANLDSAIPPWNGLAASSPSRRPLRDLLSPEAMEGISCAFCHQVHGPVRPGAAARGDYEGNPDWISTLTGVRFESRPEDREGIFGIANSGYSLDPRELLLGAGAKSAVVGDAHGRPSDEARKYLASSEFCGSCHDVRLFGTDAIARGEHFKRLRNAYSEWRTWADDERRAGREPASCQDCHMSTFPGVCEVAGDADATLGQLAAGATALARACPPGTVFAARAPGSVATGSIASGSAGSGEIAPHYFTGVDVPLSPEFPKALVDDPTLDPFGLPRGAKQRRDLLLGRTFRFEIDGATKRGGQLEIPIVLENVGAGHRVPAGFSQEREFWVHLVVRDAAGNVIYEVGRVDRNDEDLRDKIFAVVNVDDSILDGKGQPLGMFGADVIDGPDLPLWDPPPITGATTVRGRGLINLQNGFLRCVTCIGEIDGRGRCQPSFGQGRHRADRFADGVYDADTGECESNLFGDEKFFETFFPVGGLDATRGVLKAPDAIIDTRSAPPGKPLRFTYELDAGRGGGPFEIEARLLFRAFPPFLIRAFADYEARMDARGLRPSGPLVTRAMLERLEVVELHRVRVTLP